jgi:hypothetical protein
VLVPMLLLLPPATVPLARGRRPVLVRLTTSSAAGLRAAPALRDPDAWHASGPALVLRHRRRAPARPLEPSRCWAPRCSSAACSTPGSATLREAAAAGRSAAEAQGARARRDGRRLPGADRLPRGPRRHAPRGPPCSSSSRSRAADAAGPAIADARIEQAQSRLQLAIRERSGCSPPCAAWATPSPPSSTSTRCRHHAAAARSKRSTPTPAA